MLTRSRVCEKTLVLKSPTGRKNVILRACDFFDLLVFLRGQMCFSPLQKGVILSEAPRRSIAYQRVYGAKSKDPGGVFWADALCGFPATNYKGN